MDFISALEVEIGIEAKKTLEKCRTCMTLEKSVADFVSWYREYCSVT